MSACGGDRWTAIGLDPPVFQNSGAQALKYVESTNVQILKGWVCDSAGWRRTCTRSLAQWSVTGGRCRTGSFHDQRDKLEDQDANHALKLKGKGFGFDVRANEGNQLNVFGRLLDNQRARSIWPAAAAKSRHLAPGWETGRSQWDAEILWKRSTTTTIRSTAENVVPHS